MRARPLRKASSKPPRRNLADSTLHAQDTHNASSKHLQRTHDVVGAFALSKGRPPNTVTAKRPSAS
eukprot:10188064-Alexandrium_andersonii.AAC.1